MVTAIETPSTGFLPAELADDEIVITQWLADDLGIGPGAKVTLKYFVMGERRQLEEKSREFTVLAVLPMSEPQLNSSWMPDFPGTEGREELPRLEAGLRNRHDEDAREGQRLLGAISRHTEGVCELESRPGNVGQSLGKCDLAALARRHRSRGN
jgi:hypothetical protein